MLIRRLNAVLSMTSVRFWRRGDRSRARQRGAALVEMAVAGPLFFMLLFGIIEFGRVIWLYGTISHAAREAARYAIVRGEESGRAVTAIDVETYVRNRAPGLSAATVTTTWEPDNKSGSVVQVRVQLPFDPVVPILPPLPLSTTSRLVISF